MLTVHEQVAFECFCDILIIRQVFTSLTSKLLAEVPLWEYYNVTQFQLHSQRKKQVTQEPTLFPFLLERGPALTMECNAAVSLALAKLDSAFPLTMQIFLKH